MRPHARLLVPLLAAGLLASACTAAPVGNGSASPSASPSTAPIASPTSGPSMAYRLPDDPKAVILRIDTAGGFVAPGFFLTHMPQFSLYADGRVITPGPVIAIYPGPLLPNLRESQLTPAEVQRLLGAADEAGLLGPDASYDAQGVADAGTTTFTTTVDGKTHRISAYALGIGSDGLLGSAEIAQRQKLADFLTKVGDLKALLGRTPSDVEYVATHVRVFVAAPAKPEPPMTQQVLPWPLTVDLATGAKTHIEGTRCLLLGGADATTFTAAARTANALTVWRTSTGSYSTQVRPLLPDESGCTA